jgi:hypothetical protein
MIKAEPSKKPVPAKPAAKPGIKRDTGKTAAPPVRKPGAAPKLKPGELSKQHPVSKAHMVKLSDQHKALGHGERPLKYAPGPGGGGTPGKIGKHKVSELDAFLWAEGEQESGNNYLATNPTSGALGRWQVMPDNLPQWLPESGQPVLSPNQFLNSKAAQNAVAYTILGGYFKKYGPAGAAAEWYSGQPNPEATYGDPPVYQYVDDVLAYMDSPDVAPIASSGSSVTMPWNLPVVTSNDSWSSQVRNSATVLTSTGKSATDAANAIRATYRK